MMILFPLVSVAVQPLTPAVEMASSRAAQVRLAELIGDADSVHSITVRRAPARPRGAKGTRTRAQAAIVTAIEVALDRDTAAYRVVATIDARGEVTSLSIDRRAPATDELGSLSWLSPEIANATAITRIAVDEDDAITLTTDTGEALMIIPGRGSGGRGNEAAAARWAAAWDSPEA